MVSIKSWYKFHASTWRQPRQGSTEKEGVKKTTNEIIVMCRAAYWCACAQSDGKVPFYPRKKPPSPLFGGVGLR